MHLVRQRPRRPPHRRSGAGIHRRHPDGRPGPEGPEHRRRPGPTVVLARAVAGLLLLLFSAPVRSEDPFRKAAQREIRRLLDAELRGLYDVRSVEVVEVVHRVPAWSGAQKRFGLRSVTADFVAGRNASRDESLNDRIPPDLCEREAELYLLCRPPGYELSGTLEVDLALTVDGWRILSRHEDALQPYPLAGYLRCRPDPADPDPDAAAIQACFGAPPRRPSP